MSKVAVKLFLLDYFFYTYLLVNDDKPFIIIWTDFVFQCNDLLHAIFNELPLCAYELLPLCCTLVEKARVDLCLFILQRDVAGQNVGVLNPLLHVWVSGTMIQHQASYQSKKKRLEENRLELNNRYVYTVVYTLHFNKTHCVSQSVLCFINMISTMYRSMASLGLAMAITASTTACRQMWDINNH